MYGPPQVPEWLSRADSFHQQCKAVCKMFSHLTGIPNRPLLYDIYQYIWDAKETCMLLDSYISWLGKLIKYKYFKHVSIF